jgi:hypothetical protein
MNVVDNLNSVYINKPCVCTRTMRLSPLAALRRDREHLPFCNYSSGEEGATIGTTALVY